MKLAVVAAVGVPLIVPPLATRRMPRRRLPAAWALGAAGYAGGLLLSTTADLPSGPTIVWVLVALAIVAEVFVRARAEAAVQLRP